MSCPSEAVCLLYAEDELDAAAHREVDAHLVGCRGCRERVVSLRDEGRLIGAVLHEKFEARERPAAATVAPEPGVAMGVPIAIAAATLALAGASFLLEARLPGAWDLLNPRRLKGVSEMAFDLVFLLRESAPGLLELALAVGSVAALSALLSFGVSYFGRRFIDRAALSLVVLLFAAGDARAFDLRLHEDVRIEAGQRIEESVLASGERVDVDGVIDGDLIVAAERVTVRGEVTGSLYVFTRDLEITGRVGGGVHAIAEEARIEGEVVGSIFGISEDFTITSSGTSGGDVNLIAAETEVSGTIGRDLQVMGDRLDLRGRIGRDVKGHNIREVELRDGLVVKRDVIVSLEDDVEIVPAPGASIGGELQTSLHIRPHKQYLEHYRSWRFYAVNLLWFAAAFLFGLVAYQVVPSLFAGAVVTGSDLGRTLALGVVGLVVTPLAVGVLGLTVVGIPIAVALLFVFVVALYCADLAVAAWLGRILAPPADDSTLAFGKALAVGLALLLVVGLVPFLGPAVGLVTMLLGMGMLAGRAREGLYRLSD